MYGACAEVPSEEIPSTQIKESEESQNSKIQKYIICSKPS